MSRPTTNHPTHQTAITSIMEANSIACLMGWAAVGVEYANPDKMHAPSGSDYANAAAAINRLLIDTCRDIETLQNQHTTPAPSGSNAQALLNLLLTMLKHWRKQEISVNEFEEWLEQAVSLSSKLVEGKQS